MTSFSHQEGFLINSVVSGKLLNKLPVNKSSFSRNKATHLPDINYSHFFSCASLMVKPIFHVHWRIGFFMKVACYRQNRGKNIQEWASNYIFASTFLSTAIFQFSHNDIFKIIITQQYLEMEFRRYIEWNETRIAILFETPVVSLKP